MAIWGLSSVVVDVIDGTTIACSAVLNSGTSRVTVSGTVDITASGAWGLDAGSAAVSTWYAVWIAKGETGSCFLLSASAASPALPAGYDAGAARVAWVRNQASGLLWRTRHAGNTTVGPGFGVSSSGFPAVGEDCKTTLIYSGTGSYDLSWDVSDKVPPGATAILLNGGHSGTAGDWIMYAKVGTTYHAGNYIAMSLVGRWNVIVRFPLAEQTLRIFRVPSGSMVWGIGADGWEDAADTVLIDGAAAGEVTIHVAGGLTVDGGTEPVTGTDFELDIDWSSQDALPEITLTGYGVPIDGVDDELPHRGNDLTLGPPTGGTGEITLTPTGGLTIDGDTEPVTGSEFELGLELLSVPAPAIDRLTTAVETLAAKEARISINRGSVVYSVDTGDVTEEEV